LKSRTVLQQPLKPVVLLSLLFVTLGLGVATGIAYWNGADRMGKTYIAQPGNLYYKLELSRLIIDTNYSLVAPNRLRMGLSIPLEMGAEMPEPTKPPVPYLPREVKPTPTPDVVRLSANFKEVLREITVARLEQGGMVIPDEFMPDPKDPANRIPVPEGARNPGNGFLKLYFEVNRDAKQKGAVQFRISYELWRQIYLTQDAPFTNSIKVAEGQTNAVRVWEKHLESAIIYELEQLIARRIVAQYRAANPNTKGK
jgi:hypothetical protein